MKDQTTEQIIGRKFRVTRKLADGGMGSVFEAINLNTGGRVALKVIVAEAVTVGGELLERFKREAMVGGRIDSPHVVSVYDADVDAETRRPYIVMEYLSGEDVEKLVHRVGVLPPGLALRITAQACLGLKTAHEAGIVHRDIKSANMFLSRREGSDEVVLKLVDFGIAKVREDQYAAGESQGLTRPGSVLGSPFYMSPEQVTGETDLDHRSDIWSLGVALYEMLSGVTPHAHIPTNMALFYSICCEDALPLSSRAPGVPAEVAEIVHKALSRDPAGRFQTAVEMGAALSALLPEGSAIHESMLASLRAAPVSVVVPRQEPRSSESILPVTAPELPALGAESEGPPSSPRPPSLPPVEDPGEPPVPSELPASAPGPPAIKPDEAAGAGTPRRRSSAKRPEPSGPVVKPALGAGARSLLYAAVLVVVAVGVGAALRPCAASPDPIVPASPIPSSPTSGSRLER